MPEEPIKENIFERWNNNIRQGEASFVNFISAIAPWGAPLPAAYMSWWHMTTVLLFPVWLAWAVAAVIEILGFSTVSTVLTFWMHNRNYKDDKKKTPVWTALFSFAFYLFIVITMNVVLDLTAGTANAKYAEVFVRGLLTLMTIPAAVILGVRTQHQELLGDINDTKETRMVKTFFKNKYGDNWELYYIQFATGKNLLGSLGSETYRTSEPTGKRKAVFDYIDGYYSANGYVPKLEEIVTDVHVAQSTASDYRNEWLKNNPEKGKPNE